jgi:hypothetical protein
MHDHLSAKNLLAHIEHLSKHIGPRPTGSPQEEQAHAYIRRILTANDVSNIEEQVFFTPSTAAISFGIPLGMYVISNLFGLVEICRFHTRRLHCPGQHLFAVATILRTIVTLQTDRTKSAKRQPDCTAPIPPGFPPSGHSHRPYRHTKGAYTVFTAITSTYCSSIQLAS